MSLVVVVGRETAQPARQSESARRRALGTTRKEPGAARKLATWARFRHPNWASEGARSPGLTGMLFPNAGFAPAGFSAFKRSLALMSNIVACVRFRPVRDRKSTRLNSSHLG